MLNVFLLSKVALTSAELDVSSCFITCRREQVFLQSMLKLIKVQAEEEESGRDNEAE